MARGKRKQRTEAEIVNEVLNSPVEFREGGKSKRARRIEVLIKSLGAAALKGDVSAAEALLKLRANFEGIPPSNQSLYGFTERDHAASSANIQANKEDEE